MNMAGYSQQLITTSIFKMAGNVCLPREMTKESEFDIKVELYGHQRNFDHVHVEHIDDCAGKVFRPGTNGHTASAVSTRPQKALGIQTCYSVSVSAEVCGWKRLMGVKIIQNQKSAQKQKHLS